MYNLEENIHSNIEVDNVAKSYLLETAKWAKFLGILGFIFSAFMTLGGISMELLGALNIGGNYPTYGVMNFTVVGLVYIILAIVFFYPPYALVKFSTKMKAALGSSTKDGFNNGLNYLKGVFRFYGIFAVVYLVLMVLIIVFLIIKNAGAQIS